MLMSSPSTSPLRTLSLGDMVLTKNWRVREELLGKAGADHRLIGQRLCSIEICTYFSSRANPPIGIAI